MGIITSNLRDYARPYFTHPSFPVHGECTDFVIEYGVRFERLIYIDKSAFNVGSTVTFNWGDNEVILTVVSTLLVDDYGTNIDSNAAFFHFGASFNALLGRDFEFFLDFDDAFFSTILIVAREPGVAYNLTVMSSTAATSTLSVTSGEDIELNNDITILCDVYKAANDVDYDFIGTIKSNLVFSGFVVDFQYNFDLAEFLHRNLKCEAIAWNDYSELGLLRLATDSCRRFKLVLRQSEGWAGALVIDWYTVLRGGLSKRDYIRYRTDYFGYYPDDLLWRMINYVTEYTELFYTVTKNQKIVSTFFCNQPIGYPSAEHEFYVDMTDVLGATGTGLIYVADLLGQSKNILHYSYNDLSIDTIASGLGLAAIKSFRIRAYNVADTTDHIIDSRVLIENDYREQFFVFENSIGGFQTIRTLGEHEYGVEVEKDEFEKIIPVLALLNEDFMVSETYGHMFKGQIFSGWLEKADLYNFLDFINSENIWKQDDRHESFVPVKIVKGSWTLEKKSNNGVYQYGFNFQYIETTKNKHLTDLIAY